MISIFAPPAVEEVLISGLAWGLSANISCGLVHPDDFRMFRIVKPGAAEFKFNVSGLEQCLSKAAQSGCNETFTTNVRNRTGDSLGPFQQRERFPNWYDDAGTTRTGMDFSHLVAADGDYGSHDGPFTRQSGYDPFTYDAMLLGRPSDETTTAIFEFFLWEWPLNKKTDGTSYDPHRDYKESSIRCDVRSAVGQAVLDPLSRTYANFTRGIAPTNPFDSAGNIRIKDVVPPQIIAANALSNGPNIVDLESTTYAYQSSAVWKSLRSSLNLFTEPPDMLFGIPGARYNGIDPMLNDTQVLLSIYKLLGESVITLMNEGGVDPWEGNLYKLETTSYLVAGPVSWIYVIVLLSCWAFLVSSSALWLMVSCRPRWAKSLDGSEMFKFGAQFTDEMNEFKSTDFRHCGDALNKVPGMVGVLPGLPVISTAVRDKGFIGLSENKAREDMLYIMDRREAAMTRVV